MRQKYDEALSAYQDVAEQLAQEYMSAPTHFVIVGSTADYRYGLMDEGVYAAVTQVENDFNTLKSSVNGLINQVNALGYEIESSEDVDEVIANLIEVIN